MKNGLLYFIAIVFLVASCSQVPRKVDYSSPWQEFEANSYYLTDSRAMYLFEANSKEPATAAVLAKEIVDFEESRKIVNKRNEFEYKDAINNFEKVVIPENLTKNKGIKNLKTRTELALGPYDFKEKKFTFKFNNDQLITYDIGYALRIVNADEFNSIKIPENQAKEMIKKFEFGESSSERKIFLDIYFEPVGYERESHNVRFITKEYKVILGKIHSIRIYRSLNYKNDLAYMISLVNNKIYDTKNKKKL